jgi:hypothetical protein
MKPNCKIAWIQAINYVAKHGGCMIEFKEYGYTECSNSVNVYWQKSTGKCFLFADSINLIYDSLEITKVISIHAGLPTSARDQIVETWSHIKEI